jgi:hypothetical protein
MYYECAVEALPTPLQTFKSLFPPTLLRMEMVQGGSGYNAGNSSDPNSEKGR